jgi:hypothetical protein
MAKYSKQYESVLSLGENKKLIPPWKVKGDKEKKLFYNVADKLAIEMTKNIFKAVAMEEWVKRNIESSISEITLSSREKEFIISMDIKHYSSMISFPRGMTSMKKTILSYIDELYPEFQDDNPFEKEFAEYPFKNISFAHLFIAENISERMELLADAEAEKMDVATFTNFCINHGCCRKEHEGIDYSASFSTDQRIYKLYEDKRRNVQKKEQLKTCFYNLGARKVWRKKIRKAVNVKVHDADDRSC